MTTPGGEGGLFHFRQDIDVSLNEIRRSLQQFPSQIDPLAERIQNSLFFGAAFSSEGINQFVTDVETGVGKAVSVFDRAGPAINEAISAGVRPEQAFAAFNEAAIREVNSLQRIFTEGLSKGLIPPGLVEQLNGLAAKVSEAFKSVGGSVSGGGGGVGSSAGLDAATQQLQTTTRALVSAFEREVQATEELASIKQFAAASERRAAEARLRLGDAAEEENSVRAAALKASISADQELVRAKKQLANATTAESEASAARRGVSADAERQLAEAAARVAESAPRPSSTGNITPAQLLAESIPNPERPTDFRGGPTTGNLDAGRTTQIGPSTFARTDSASVPPQFFDTRPASATKDGGVIRASADIVDPTADPVRFANLQRKDQEQLATNAARLEKDSEARARLTQASELLANVENESVRQLSASRFFNTRTNQSFDLKPNGRSDGALEAFPAGAGASATDRARIDRADVAERERILREQTRLGDSIAREVEGRTAVQRDLASRQATEKALAEQNAKILQAEALRAQDGNGATRLGDRPIRREDATGDVFRLRERPALDLQSAGANVTEATKLTGTDLDTANRAFARQTEKLTAAEQVQTDQAERVARAQELLSPAVSQYVSRLEKAGLVIDQTSEEIFRLRNETKGPLAGQTGATKLTGQDEVRARAQFDTGTRSEQNVLGSSQSKLTEQEQRLALATEVLRQQSEGLAVRIGTTDRYYSFLNNEVLKLTEETKGAGRQQIGATSVAKGDQAEAIFQADRDKIHSSALQLNNAMLKDAEALAVEARQAELAAKLDDGRAQTLRGGNIRDLTNGRVFNADATKEITNPLQLRRINEAPEPPKGLVGSFLGGLSSKGFNSEGDDSPGLTGIAGTAGNLAKYGLVAKALQDVFSVVGALKAGVLDEAAALVNLDVALQGTAASSVNYADASTAAAAAGINSADAINIGAIAIQTYGNEIRSNTDANRVFEESIKAVGVAAVITGLSTAEAQKSLIQASQGFGTGSEGQDRINNAVSNGARNFRGNRGEILKGVGVAAGAADLAGVSPEELANIVSLIQGRTQQGGEQVGTSLTRLLSRAGDPAFAKALSKAQIPNTGNFAQEIPALSEFFQNLGKSPNGDQAQTSFIKSLGSRDALKNLLPLFQQGSELPGATDKSFQNGGAAADDYGKRINSLAGELASIVAEFKDLATEIGKSGIFAPIGVFVEALRPALGILNDFLKVINSIPAELRVPLIAFGELAAAIIVARKAAEAGITIRGLIGLGAAKAGAAKERVAGSIAEAGGAGATTGALAGEDAALAGNTGAVNANSAAKRLNVNSTRAQIEASLVDVEANRAATISHVELGRSVTAQLRALQGLGVLEGENAAAARATITVTETERLARLADAKAIEEQAAALAVLNAEQRGSLGAGVAGGAQGAARLASTETTAVESGLGARVGSAAGAASGAIRGFATSLTGVVTIAIAAGIAAKSLISESDRLISSYGKQSDAARFAGAATDVSSLDAATSKVSQAGAARSRGASGVFGTIEDFGIQALGGQSGRDANRDAQGLVTQLRNESKAIADQAQKAAVSGDSGVFNGRITSVEQLTAGIAKLDATGTSAAREVQAVVDAFTGITKISPAVASSAIAGTFGSSIGDNITKVLGKTTSNAAVNGVKIGNFFPDIPLPDPANLIPGVPKLSIPTKPLAEGVSQLFGGSGNFDNFSTQLSDPKKVAETRKKIGEAVSAAVNDAGVQNFSDLTDQQKTDLSNKVANLYVGDSHIRGKDLQRIRDLEAAQIRGQLDNIANAIPQGDQVTSTAVQALIAQKAKASGQAQGAIAGGDPVVAARATLDALTQEAAVAASSGTQVSEASLADIETAKLALAQGLVAQGKAYSDLAISARPADAAFGLAQAVEQANVRLQQDVSAGASAVQQVQDQTAINAALTAQRSKQFSSQNALNLSVQGGNIDNVKFGSDGSVTGGAIDPRLQTQQAGARLINARNNLNLARSQGADAGTLAPLIAQYTQSYFDYTTSLVNDSNLNRDAAVAVGDRVGEAYAKATGAYASAAALPAGSPQQRVALRNAAELAAGAAIANANQNAAIASAKDDPRDKVGGNFTQLQSDQTLLNVTTNPKDRADLVKKIKADKIALNQSIEDQLEAQREATTDPRDTIREAGLATVRARGALVLALPGTQAYADAQKQLRITTIALAVAQTQLANDARDASADPASRVQQAAARLADAQAILKNDLKNSDQYYKDLKAVNDAKVALADANLAAARDTAELKIDTTDPVAEANLAAKSARDKLAADRARKAAPDVINADLLNVEKTAESAQKAQLDQQLSLHATQYQLRQISLAQYLTFLRNQDTSLRTQLAATKKGSEGYQQLVDELNGVDQTIQGLNSTASGLFNIGSVKAPTIFQIRNALGVKSTTDPTVFAPVTGALSTVVQPAALASSGLNSVSRSLTTLAARTATFSGLLASPVSGGVATAPVSSTINNVTINGVDFAKVVAYLNSILGQQSNRTSTTPRRVR